MWFHNLCALLIQGSFYEISVILSIFVLFFTDINECTAGTHTCDKRTDRGLCTNNVGSFTCSCASGYQLAQDQRTCEGQLCKSAIVNYFITVQTVFLSSKMTNWNC